MPEDYFYSKYKTNELFKELDQNVLFGIREQSYFQIGNTQDQTWWRSSWIFRTSDLTIDVVFIACKWADRR